MRCRSTKEAGELVSRVLGDHLQGFGVEAGKLDHAAIAMVRSRRWEEVPQPTAYQGLVKKRGLLYFLHTNACSGEIPWR